MQFIKQPNLSEFENTSRWWQSRIQSKNLRNKFQQFSHLFHLLSIQLVHLSMGNEIYSKIGSFSIFFSIKMRHQK